jgi:chloramphenicol 3-O phosphotransferase
MLPKKQFSGTDPWCQLGGGLPFGCAGLSLNAVRLGFTRCQRCLVCTTWRMSLPGRVIILNGVPRAGKSSVARAVQDGFEGLWLNLGVDTFWEVTPPRARPGIGLRPGGERPDLEDDVLRLYEGLFGSVLALRALGLDVIVDVGLHDDYARPLGIHRRVAVQLAGTPAYFVGVRCPLEVIMTRRAAGTHDGGPSYERSSDGTVPEAVLRWQRAVHTPGIYDVEVDTSVLSPQECAELIGDRMRQGPPTALTRIASGLPPAGNGDTVPT